MKFLPPVESMDQPMFWSDSEQTDLLKGELLSMSFNEFKMLLL